MNEAFQLVMDKLNEMDCTMKSEFKQIKEEISDIKSDVNTLKSDVNTLGTRVSALENQVSGLRADVNTLKTVVTSHGEKIEQLRVAIFEVADTEKSLEKKWNQHHLLIAELTYRSVEHEALFRKLLAG